MKEFVITGQIVISIILAALILLQNQGAGLGNTFGGGGEFYRSRRGLERLLFQATIACAVLFLAFSLVNFSLA